jgi:ATP-dependent Clp protease adapter protein ClpS
MADHFRVNELRKYQILLENDDGCPYSEVTKALKLIFNMTEAEAGFAAISAGRGKETIIEVVHNEKLSLRKEQIKKWEEKGGSTLPIKFKIL